MKSIHAYVCTGLVLVLAVALAAFALFGAPSLHFADPLQALQALQPAHALALAPFAFGGNTSASEVLSALEEHGKAFTQFRDKIDTRMSALEQHVIEDAKKSARIPFSGAQGSDTPERKAMNSAVRALMAGDKAKAEAHFVEAKAMIAGSGPDGGYVTSALLSDGFTQVLAEISPVYRLARKIPLDAGFDSFEEPVDNQVATATWVGEAESRAETATPQLKMFSVFLHEIYALPKISQKLLDVSSMDMLAWLQQKVGEGFGVKEGAAFHTGDGVGKPRGFLDHDVATTTDATRAWGTLQYIPAGASGAFPNDITAQKALVDMVTALKPQYRTGAVWLMNRNTAGVVQKLMDDANRMLWTESLIQGQPATLLGFPVEIDEDMPDISAGSLSIAFGNVARAYTIIEKPGIKFLPDPFSAKPHVLLYSYRRVGGGLNNSEAMKLLRFSAT